MGIFAALFIFVILLLSLNYLKGKDRRKRLADAVDQFGGSPWYPIIGTTLTQLRAPREELYQLIYDRSEKFGPIFRSWVGSIPQLHFTKAKHAEVVLKSSVNITKGMNYDFVKNWLGDGLITGTGSYWQRHRKLITPTFHFKILDSFQEVFSEKAHLLVEELKPLANGEYFDISTLVTHCALDIICETAMGVEINAMKSSDSEYVKAIYRILEIFIYRWFRPWLHSDFIFGFTAKGKEQRQVLKVLHGFSDKVIADRKKIIQNSQGMAELSEEDKLLGKKRRLAFLDLLLQQNMEKNEWTDKELREEVDTFMFAGHDTTTSSVLWNLFALGNYPEIQEKVYEEIDSIFHGEERPILPEDVARMQYMERVMKETLRIYSVIPYILRRLEEDIEIEGKIIPAGVSVAIHITNIHKDPEQFPDPFRFDPDRFLPENVAKRNPYSHIPFSAGPRNCIGQKFAIRNTKTMLTAILRKYKVKSKLKPEEMKFYGDIILKPQEGIFISLEPRN
ncbi:cytochrome P450 4C1-like [Coccinella septempunctata]|uniref:cytochrome P450 4C1-like n=1 Tax=Coccinella septempunctata TaxID=41139 RepID=UPI001D05D4E6|nr:cytochrome P450 4C1-like [Coccinella septempunctata]XP_044745744.1 cytochrome P450 4C1-like [Coccinella septempunctata]